jgi:teichuronic acid biosynthesis glycosyltransferase TuaC
MLRVLSISTLFPSPPRPAFGKFVASQMRAVAARGDVDLVMVNPIGVPPWPLSRRAPYDAYAACPDMSDLDGLPVHHPRFTLIPMVGGDSNPARIARAVLPLARRLHAQKPFDVVDAQFFFPDGPAAAIVARALGLPLTIKSRGADIHYWGARPKARTQMLTAAHQAARLLSVSDSLGADMAAMGMPATRITTHYTGLDHSLFRLLPPDQIAARMAQILPIDAPLFVATGALIERKGQALAIRALAQVPQAHLALAGKGPDEAALKALTAELGLASRVHFLGQVSHDALPILLNAATALVLPSASEGLANAWVEALACGAALVIPDIDGAREIVTTPAAGRLTPRDPDAIAQSLRDLLANPPQREQTAACAARFTWAANAQALVEIWLRLRP